MKNLLCCFICLITFLASESSYAQGGGDKVGNGGDVIVCPDGKIQLLDIFQGEEDWELVTRTFLGTREQIITAVLENFIAVDPVIGNLLKQRALLLGQELNRAESDQNYRSPLVKLTNRELVNIADEGVASLPEGCRIVQAASQVQRPFGKEPKFKFQSGIWEKMEPEVQAALILHEVIYEHLVGVGENYSRSARYFNAALHSGLLDTVKGYFEVSTFFEFRNLDMPLGSPARTYGAKGICKVIREYFVVNRVHENHIERRGGTFIWIGKRLAARSEFYLEAMQEAHAGHIMHGKCD